MDPVTLADIANRARLLTVYGPENARMLQQSNDRVSICRADQSGDLSQWLENAEHAADEYQQQQREVIQLVHELVDMVYRDLPEVDIHHLDKIHPGSDWGPLVDELELIKNVARRKAASIAETPPQGYVTLLQAAALINKDKRTLERWKQKDTNFPTPEVIGDPGEADEWLWSTIRPYLEKKAKRKLADTFPAHVGMDHRQPPTT